VTNPKIPLESFETFGDMLKYLRRREHLTQMELSIAVGYSDAQITRLEKNQRRPEIAALKALFIPALHIENDPEVIARFLDLAESARQEESPVQGVPPYKGLLSFEESDSDLFFGRESLTQHLVGRVEEFTENPTSHFLTIVGASGSGKSSLVRAGLAVELKHRDWHIIMITPGADPAKSLEMSLGDQAAPTRVLLIVDQFEETFTLCHNESERVLFIEKLLNLARETKGKYFIVIALRADFYSHCAQYPLLRQSVAAEQEYIGQMTRDELRRAIEEPARCGGWEFEPGLVDLLLNDIGAQGTGEPEPGALPLLSHALLATWERRRGRTLTFEGYHASGGIRGAIAETAENVFNDQLNQSQQELARDVFLRLTELGEGTEDTRRRAALNELVRGPAEATQLRLVLNTLAEARLITLNEDSAEVAHEALIREWQRLHEWLTQDREGLLLHRHLTESAHEWERRGNDPSELYRGARLAQAREWAAGNAERLNILEQSFLNVSVEQEEYEALAREEQRQRELEAAQKLAETEKARAEEQASAAKRYRWRGMLLTGALSLVIVAAIFAGAFAKNMQRQTLVSSVRELSNAANLNLEVDPERSILLALQAVDMTYSRNHTVLPEAEDALRSALQASHLELTLRGHTDNIWSAEFSPDGKRIATASADGTAKIWDAATGEELLSIRGSNVGIVWSAIFSPDGKYLVTTGQDYFVHIWDSTNGKAVSTLKGHLDEVYQARFSSDGRQLVTISTDGWGIIWDASTGKIIQKLGPEVDGIPQWVNISPDGSQVAIAYATSTTGGWITIWDSATGRKILRLPNQHAGMRSVSYSPDGTHLVTTSDDQAVRIWDARDGKMLQEFYNQTGKIANAEYSLDGTRIATPLGTNQVVVWEAATGRTLLTLAGHTGSVNAVAFNPDGTRLVTAGKDHTARVWSLAPSRELLTLQQGPTIASSVGSKLAYSPDGKYLAVSYSDPTAKVWEVATGRLIHTLSGHTAGVNYITYSVDGTRIATTADDGTAKVWEAASGKELFSLAVANSGDRVFGAAFSPDGKQLGTAADNNAADIWDAVSGKFLFKLPGITDWVASIAFSPDGSKIATSSFDGTASLWDAATGKLLFHFTGFTNTVRQVAFSPDGKRLAASSLDDKVKVWDAASGKEILTLTRHSGPVFSVTFSPDGKYLATASGDRTARLWDAGTGKEILLVRAPDELTGVAVSPDDSQLAVASRDGTARIYLLKIEDLVALAKTRVTRTLTTEECQQYLHIPACPAQ
jgi:WD40 repeat protein/transcriptional regulator with XRE-family HTH domain